MRRLGVAVSTTVLFVLASRPDVVAQTVERAFALASPADLEAHGVKVEAVSYRGRAAVRLTELPGNQRRALALLKGTSFKDGTIEVELAGLPAAGAAEAARGFVGIAFRVNGDRFECFYLRPTNGRSDDQLRRNHSTQYISEPEFPWQRLRQEAPGVYESYVDLEPGAWMKVKIAVAGRKARLFVHDAPQPALVVNDLKLGETQGAVALWIGPGTEAYFSNLRVAR
jgi:hypothetical protein